MDFQKVVDFKPLNDKATVAYFKDPSLIDMKALIISDCHFCRYYEFTKSFEKFKAKLLKLLETEIVNTIIILGDVIHIRTEGAEEHLKTFLDFFQTLPYKVFYIGGNHDRHISRSISYPKTSNITIIKDLAFCFVHPNSPPKTPKRIFLTHDLHNHHRMSAEMVHSWHMYLRKTFAYLMNPDDYLITGHTHETVISVDELTASVAPFSIDLVSSRYCILTMKDGIQLTFPEKTPPERFVKTGFDPYSAPHTAKQ